MREKKEDNVFLGGQIRIAREHAGLTQEKLAEQLDISTNHLSAIERGVYGISVDNLRKLCRLLDVSADYLLFGSVPGPVELEAAQKLAAVDPKYREVVMKGLAALLELSEMK